MKRLLIIILVLLSVTCYLFPVSAQTALTLDSCLQLARQNNAAIRKSELAVERAEQVRLQAMTKYFPQVQAMAVGYHSLRPPVDLGIDDIANASVRDLLLTLYGNYGAALGLENTISLFQHGVIAGVTAIQPVFMGGKVVAGNQLARVGVEAAQLQQQMTERDLLLQVEESYWLVVGLQDKQRTLLRATALIDTAYRIMSTAVDYGLALPQDLMQIEVRRSELSRQQLRLTSGLKLATRALCQSIGLSMDSANFDDLMPKLDDMDMPLYAELPAGYVLPESDLLALQTRAAELQRTMAIADALPHVAVGANYGYSHLDANILRNGLGGWNGALFVTVSVPLTGWWEAGHKIREHSLRLEEAQIEQRDLNEKLQLRSQQTLDQLQEAYWLAQQLDKAAETMRERYRLTEASYRAGMATITDLLTAESELFATENELTDARIAYRVSLHRYRDLSGLKTK